jgi:hypothetical protein
MMKGLDHENTVVDSPGDDFAANLIKLLWFSCEMASLHDAMLPRSLGGIVELK